MGFTMINVFLAIIMDAYADVVHQSKKVRAHLLLCATPLCV